MRIVGLSPRVVLGVFFLAGINLQTAAALPINSIPANAMLNATPFAADWSESDIDFSGIVALNNCSGSLVRFTTSQPEDKALVLTNGHCYEGGFLDPGEVIQGKTSNRGFNLLSPDASNSLATLYASEVVYATMTDTDVTLYRLAVSYADIEQKYNIHALTLSDHRPDAGVPIRVVSGYWRRIYSCSIDYFVYNLREGDWTFKDSIRYTQTGCDIIGGTSGSPIINADTKEVIGINNTTNESGEHCTVNNPCEVDAAGKVQVKRGSGYGQETYLFYGCLTDDHNIDLSRPDCKLPKGQGQTTTPLTM